MSQTIRHDWTLDQARAIYELPMTSLLYQAQSCHRENFVADEVQASQLLSIKTGACPENCSYCPQSGHFHTEIQKEKLMSVEEVTAMAQNAKANGATRFCMGAAWRSPPKKAMPQLVEMIKTVKNMGLETCVTAGMLESQQATELKDAGLDYYNHNLDTSEEFYKEIITTRVYQDRLDTLKHVRESGMSVCCGGIIGMGESIDDRLLLLIELANLPKHPESVPINVLVPVKGTPLEHMPKVPAVELARILATARMMMPKSMLRLSAGRNEMDEATHALCFMAGANSIFLGEKLLTTPLPQKDKDSRMFDSLGVQIQKQPVAVETA